MIPHENVQFLKIYFSTNSLGTDAVGVGQFPSYISQPPFEACKPPALLRLAPQTTPQDINGRIVHLFL